MSSAYRLVLRVVGSEGSGVPYGDVSNQCIEHTKGYEEVL